MKADLNRRSSGGYPVTISSGKATRSQPSPRARPSHSRTRPVLPSMSPTMGFTWASPTLSFLMAIV